MRNGVRVALASITLLSLLLARPAELVAQPSARDHGWLGMDKLRHFVVSAFVQSFSFAALEASGVGRDRALAGATVLTLGVGIGKELHDRRSGRAFSWQDLSWDAAGAGAATLVLVRTAR